METFSVRLEVGDPSGYRFETTDALVDSGVAYTVLRVLLLLPSPAQPEQAAKCPIA